jgi:predicted AAA+ superfamily ATPase
MTEEEILSIADTWSFWRQPAPTSVSRRVDLPRQLSPSRCLVIQGVRRCGKSTLLQQLIGRYELDPGRCAFLNLEDPRLTRAQSFDTLELLVRAFRRRHGDDAELTFFLDEIQGVHDWHRWLRAQLDRPGQETFVVTGSNATLLSGELSTLLSGRHLTVELFPFDLEERRLLDAGIDLERHLHDGGFPEPLTDDDGDRLRRQYFYDIVERDVRERVRARSSVPLRQLVQMIYESAGSELSLRRAAGAVGVAVETAASYLEACEAAYLLFACPYYAYSQRKRSQRNIKYYPIDTGLRRVVVTPTVQDRGKSLECATYLALRRRFGDICYWQEGGKEVDFVVSRQRRVVPVQVSWNAPHDRHERGLEAFYERHPHAEESVFVAADNFESAFDEIEARLTAC